MKKNITKIAMSSLVALGLSLSVQAQWTRNSGSGSIYPTVINDKVGIGTNAPSYQLDIKQDGNCSFRIQSKTTGSSNLILSRSAAAGQNCLVNYKTGNADLWRTGCTGNDDFSINNAVGISNFYISQATSNVGVGTTTPAATLAVKNTSLGGIGTKGSFQIGESSTTNLVLDNNEVQARSNGSGSILYLNYWGGNINMVQAGGNVGIRTSSPVEAPLVTTGDVGKTLAMFGKGSSGVSIIKDYAGIALNTYFDGTNWRAMSAGFGAQFQCDQNNGGVVLYQSSNGVGIGSVVTQIAPLYISPNGNMRLGDNGVVPTQKLEVNGNIAVNDGDIYLGPIDGAINAGGGLMDPIINILADIDNHAVVNGDEDLYIGDALEVGTQAYKPGGGSFATISDARLKKDVKSYNDGLEQLMKISPVTFKYNDKVKFLNPDKEYVGIIAQEMQKVAPYMVEEIALFSKSHEDKDGKVVVDDAGQNYLTYDGSALTYMLVNSVKELNIENANLKQQLMEMQECVASLCNAQTQKTTINEATDKTALEQNQPNPFNQSTVINYQLNKGDQNAQIIVRDLNGNMVKQINLNQTGKGQVSISANELAQGTYTYTLIVSGKSIDTKLMVLVK